jgi:hypothetical protein
MKRELCAGVRIRSQAVPRDNHDKGELLIGANILCVLAHCQMVEAVQRLE